jgi:curved DNA-binding protein CbpA
MKALKYHPDRNPGREAEFNAKFQAIQAANEILSDPQQRLKYDTDRLRAGYGKVYGPPKANTQRKSQPPPWARQTPTSAAPPPPDYQNKQTGPSAGARRYASHARAGPQQWQKPQDEGQTRADAFRGFSNMRGPHGWQGFDPATGRAAGAAPGPRAQRHPFGNSRPKSAFETFQKAYSKTESPKKKQGFAPGAAGGDEPMARNTSAYSSSSRAERPSSQYFESAVPPTAKKPAAPEPPQHPFSPEFERSSRGYSQAGKGERTFVSSTPLGRSESVRTPSGSYHTSAQKPSTPTSGRSGRHRSASPKPSKTANNYDSTSASESEDDAEDSEYLPRFNGPKPKAVPKSRIRTNQKLSDMYRQEQPGPGNGKDPFSFILASSLALDEHEIVAAQKLRSRPKPYGYRYADTRKGHTSDSAAFPKGSNRADQQYQSSGSPFTAKYARSPSSSHCFVLHIKRIGMNRRYIRSVLSLQHLGGATQMTCTKSSLPKTGGSIWDSLIYSVRLQHRQARNHCHDRQTHRVGDVLATDGLPRQLMGHLCRIPLVLRLSINPLNLRPSSNSNLLPLPKRSSPRTRGLSSYETCPGHQKRRKLGRQTLLHLGARKSNPEPPSYAVLHSQQM